MKSLERIPKARLNGETGRADALSTRVFLAILPGVAKYKSRRRRKSARATETGGEDLSLSPRGWDLVGGFFDASVVHGRAIVVKPDEDG